MDEVLRQPGASWASAPTRRVKSGTAAWDPLLVCVAVYLATSVGRVHQLFPALLPFKPALLSAVLAIGLLVLDRSAPRRVSLLRFRTTVCVVGLLLWAALSVPGALHQGLAFQSWTDFARTVVMFFVIAGSVRNARDVERLTLVYFTVTVVYTAVVLTRFQLGADSWRLGRLYYYDANDMATLIATAMPLGLYFVLAHPRPLSRGLALAVAGTSASDRYWAQMQTIVHPHQDYNATSEAGRLKIWARGVGYMVENPVFGVGLHNFQVAEGTISPLARLQERGIGVLWGAAHNSFVQVGAELGIPGLLLFVGVIATALRSLRRVVAQRTRASPSTDQVARLAQSLMAALIGFIVGGFFLSLGFADMFYTLVALAVALAKSARSDAARSAPQRHGVPA